MSMEILARDLSYYEERLGDWYAPSGTYRILIGHASDDIRLHADIVFETQKELPLRVDFHNNVRRIIGSYENRSRYYGTAGAIGSSGCISRRDE